jgi:hypothetical protein
MLQGASAAFCHGRLYVASTAIARDSTGFPQQGYIYEYILDGSYNVKSWKLVSSIAPLVGGSRIRTVLGMTCDPWDNGTNFKLYFSRSSVFRTSLSETTKNGKKVYSVNKKATFDGRVRGPAISVRHVAALISAVYISSPPLPFTVGYNQKTSRGTCSLQLSDCN